MLDKSSSFRARVGAVTILDTILRLAPRLRGPCGPYAPVFKPSDWDNQKGTRGRRPAHERLVQSGTKKGKKALREEMGWRHHLRRLHGWMSPVKSR